jgi:hypothetical protein
MSKKHVKFVRNATLFCDTLKNPRYIFFTKPYFYAIINVKHDLLLLYLKVCQNIKVCDEIDFDNILFDLALW